MSVYVARGFLCLWQKNDRKKMDGNDRVRERETDIYAHISDLGL